MVALAVAATGSVVIDRARGGWQGVGSIFLLGEGVT